MFNEDADCLFLAMMTDPRKSADPMTHVNHTIHTMNHTIGNTMLPIDSDVTPVNTSFRKSKYMEKPTLLIFIKPYFERWKELRSYQVQCLCGETEGQRSDFFF